MSISKTAKYFPVLFLCTFFSTSFAETATINIYNHTKTPLTFVGNSNTYTIPALEGDSPGNSIISSACSNSTRCEFNISDSNNNNFAQLLISNDGNNFKAIVPGDLSSMTAVVAVAGTTDINGSVEGVGDNPYWDMLNMQEAYGLNVYGTMSIDKIKRDSYTNYVSYFPDAKNAYYSSTDVKYEYEHQPYTEKDSGSANLVVDPQGSRTVVIQDDNGNIEGEYLFKWEMSTTFSYYKLDVYPVKHNFTGFNVGYVFGDSLSDRGNAFTFSKGMFPRGIYYDGRFSNGFNWVDDVEFYTGLPMIDLAVGGATITSEVDEGNSVNILNNGTLEEITKNANSGVPSLAHQINIFLAKLRNQKDTSKLKDKQSVIFVLMGGNDFGAWSRGKNFPGLLKSSVDLGKYGSDCYTVEDSVNNIANKKVCDRQEDPDDLKTIMGYSGKHDSIEQNVDNAILLGRYLANEEFFEMMNGVRKGVAEMGGNQPVIIFLEMPDISMTPAYSHYDINNNQYYAINESAREFSLAYNDELNALVNNMSNDPDLSHYANITMVAPLNDWQALAKFNWKALEFDQCTQEYYQQGISSSSYSQAVCHVYGQSNPDAYQFYNPTTFIGFNNTTTDIWGSSSSLKPVVDYNLAKLNDNGSGYTPNSRMVYDMIHPTSKMHSIIADDIIYYLYLKNYLNNVSNDEMLQEVVDNKGFTNDHDSFGFNSKAFDYLLSLLTANEQTTPTFESTHSLVTPE
ncbi:SGNH/GDSL hydrolase family protein [Thiotrichales bacterium 19X7-9]|nr:SGNH/GDSL hydrolase family protein [Thiotrichales bacterium 19X7-9]